MDNPTMRLATLHDRSWATGADFNALMVEHESALTDLSQSIPNYRWMLVGNPTMRLAALRDRSWSTGAEFNALMAQHELALTDLAQLMPKEL